MWKYLVLVLAAAGCSDTAPYKSPPDTAAALDTLDAIADDTAHDNAARAWVRRLHEQGKDKQALDVANRIRNDQIRAGVLTELQLTNLRQIGDGTRK